MYLQSVPDSPVPFVGSSDTVISSVMAKANFGTNSKHRTDYKMLKVKTNASN